MSTKRVRREGHALEGLTDPLMRVQRPCTSGGAASTLCQEQEEDKGGSSSEVGWLGDARGWTGVRTEDTWIVLPGTIWGLRLQKPHPWYSRCPNP